ncbi:MAG: adenosylcobinamide amidohydrolase [Ilumatobacter sp.]|uniref:adenosylcobinamide amidohydrolase n=1 Tax=Ilumatobacter sp. TaxID=1967498 RepID=UPI003296C074
MSVDDRGHAAPRVVDAGPTRGARGPCLVWRLPDPMRGISSSIVGGGIGPVSWVLNTTVDEDYDRLDPDLHLQQIARRLDLDGRGVAMMTAVAVSEYQEAETNGAAAWATVGISRPVWAAEFCDPVEPDAGPGTINLIVMVPVNLGDAALVNAVATATEAKVQALLHCGIDGTGTASDAVAVLCAADGTPERFGGPRSTWGGRIACAVHDATLAGIAAQQNR